MATLSIFEQKGVRVLEVIGRLDGDSASEMGQMFDRAVDAGHSALVLDLGSVDYISRPGLREIVRVFKRAQQQGGDLRVANPSDPVMSVMQLAGLDTVLQIYMTRIAAVNSF